MGLLLVDSILCSLSKTGDRGGLGLGVEFLDLEKKHFKRGGNKFIYVIPCGLLLPLLPPLPGGLPPPFLGGGLRGEGGVGGGGEGGAVGGAVELVRVGGVATGGVGVRGGGGQLRDSQTN